MDTKPRNGSDSSMSKDAEKGGASIDLHPITSIENADMVEMVDTSNGQFHRSFTPHQVHVSNQNVRSVMRTLDD